MASPTTAPLRIPETMTPKEIGAYMGGLREHFKLSVQDVSEQLHIRVRYVQAIEQGQLEQMPGKVYARGYVHTYAEFLGLDAEQVVNQCFAAEPPPAALTPVLPSGAASGTSTLMRHWRGIGIASVVAIAALVIIAQLVGGDAQEDQEAQSTVEPVPETLLESVRNLVMPTPQNIRCLNGELLLSCFYADNMTRKMTSMDRFNRALLVGDIDPNDIAALAVQEEPAEAAPVVQDQPSAAEELSKSTPKETSKESLKEAPKEEPKEPSKEAPKEVPAELPAAEGVAGPAESSAVGHD